MAEPTGLNQFRSRLRGNINETWRPDLLYRELYRFLERDAGRSRTSPRWAGRRL